MRERTFRIRFNIGMDWVFPIYGSILIMAQDLVDAQAKACSMAKENNWTLTNIDEEYP